MSKALITQSYLTDIANSIRTKLGVHTTYTPSQMSNAIDSIPSASAVEAEFIKMIERTPNTNITVPNGVTKIGRSAFSSYSDLVSVSIPNSVTTIGDYAFFFMFEFRNN